MRRGAKDLWTTEPYMWKVYREGGFRSLRTWVCADLKHRSKAGISGPRTQSAASSPLCAGSAVPLPLWEFGRCPPLLCGVSGDALSLFVRCRGVGHVHLHCVYAAYMRPACVYAAQLRICGQAVYMRPGLVYPSPPHGGHFNWVTPM